MKNLHFKGHSRARLLERVDMNTEEFLNIFKLGIYLEYKKDNHKKNVSHFVFFSPKDDSIFAAVIDKSTNSIISILDSHMMNIGIQYNAYEFLKFKYFALKNKNTLVAYNNIDRFVKNTEFKTLLKLIVLKNNKNQIKITQNKEKQEKIKKLLKNESPFLIDFFNINISNIKPSFSNNLIDEVTKNFKNCNSKKEANSAIFNLSQKDDLLSYAYVYFILTKKYTISFSEIFKLLSKTYVEDYEKEMIKNTQNIGKKRKKIISRIAKNKLNNKTTQNNTKPKEIIIDYAIEDRNYKMHKGTLIFAKKECPLAKNSKNFSNDAKKKFFKLLLEKTELDISNINEIIIEKGVKKMVAIVNKENMELNF